MSTVLTQKEFTELETWLSSHKEEMPASIGAIISRMMALYLVLAKAQAKSKDILSQLRMAMGLIPKSEKGSQLSEKHSGGV